MILDKVGVHTARQMKVALYNDSLKVKMLYLKGSVHKARELAAKVAYRAANFGDYEVAVSCYSFLHKYHSVDSPSLSRAKKFKKLERDYRELLDEEQKVRSFYLELHIPLDRNRTYSEKLKKQSLKFIAEIEKFDKPNRHGPYFYHRYFMIKCIDRSIHHDYQGQLDLAVRAYEYFQDQFIKFELSRHYFLSQMADAQLSLRNWDQCREVLLFQQQLFADNSAKNNSILLRERLNLIQGNEIDFADIENTSTDHMRQMDLISIFSRLLNGNVIENWDGMSDLTRHDPTGLGLSLRIAKLISFKLKDDIDSQENAIKEYKKRFEIDRRSELLIEFLFDDSIEVTDKMTKLPWNPDIEIYPWDLVISHISQK